jgi:hypothetical protein
MNPIILPPATPIPPVAEDLRARQLAYIMSGDYAAGSPGALGQAAVRRARAERGYPDEVADMRAFNAARLAAR